MWRSIFFFLMKTQKKNHKFTFFFFGRFYFFSLVRNENSPKEPFVLFCFVLFLVCLFIALCFCSLSLCQHKSLLRLFHISTYDYKMPLAGMTTLVARWPGTRWSKAQDWHFTLNKSCLLKCQQRIGFVEIWQKKINYALS